jgi:hypothetical protein
LVLIAVLSFLTEPFTLNGTIPWSNIKMVEIGKIDNIQLHDRSLSCHGTGTSIKYSGVNQFDGPKPTIAMK